MRVALGSDHAGWEIKEELKKLMSKLMIEYKDFGCYNEQPCDYPDYTVKVCEAIVSGQYDRGVLVCGTGIGMAIAANKMRGIYAALVDNTLSAARARSHNDSNVLVLPGQMIGRGLAGEILKIWLDTPFEGGRHEKRLKKIRDIESKLF
jgi:ribose 5-phosphate isomerase B